MSFLSFFCAILFFFFLVLVCFLCVSSTEQQLTPAFNVLFWDQVIEADQFVLFALLPSTT